jgi:hypothetical protein
VIAPRSGFSERCAPHNKRMHATRDTTAVKILNRAGGRVMRGVMRRSRGRHEWNKRARWQRRTRAAFGFRRDLDAA